MRVHTHTHTLRHTHAHTYTHTEAHTHKHSDYTKLNLHSLKWAATEMDEDISTEQKHGRSTVLGKEMLFSS